MFVNISIVNDDATLEYIPGSGPERWAPLPAIDEQKMNHLNVGRIPDVLADSESPLFESGFGLAYR